MRRNSLLLAMFSVMISSVCAQNIFQKTVGLNDGDEIVRYISPTSDKGFIITGYTTSYGFGGQDIYVSKFNSDGDLQWTRVFGGESDDQAYAVIEVTDGSFMITGKTKSFGSGNDDVIIIRTTPTGEMIWSKVYGGIKYDIGRDIIEIKSGHFLVLGNTESYGAGMLDNFLMEIDASGRVIWAKTYGAFQNDLLYNINKTNDGHFLMSGITYSFGQGNHDFLLKKVDVQGNILLCKTFGTTAEDFAYSANQAANGDIYIGGFTGQYSQRNNIVVKTDSLLNTIWQKSFGGNKNDIIYTILPADKNGVFVTGSTFSYGLGGSDVFLANFTVDGQLGFFKTYGGAGDEFSYHKCSYIEEYDKILIGANSSSFIAGNLRGSYSKAYLIKTDFSGQSGCNEATYSPVLKNANLLSQDIKANIVVNNMTWNVINAGNDTAASFIQQTLCFTHTANNSYKSEIIIKNYSNGLLQIIIPDDFNEAAAIVVSDILGKIHYSHDVKSGFAGKINLSTANFGTGIYIISVFSNTRSKSVKIVK